ncbi:hypothetical protein KC19_12G023100, partial [Ceratodon purpureus]
WVVDSGESEKAKRDVVARWRLHESTCSAALSCKNLATLMASHLISSHHITSDYGKKKIHDGFVFCHSHCLVGLCPHRHSTSPTPNLLHISLSHALFMFIHHIPSAHGIVHLNSVYSSLPIVCSLSLSVCVCVVF